MIVGFPSPSAPQNYVGAVSFIIWVYPSSDPHKMKNPPWPFYVFLLFMDNRRQPHKMNLVIAGPCLWTAAPNRWNAQNAHPAVMAHSECSVIDVTVHYHPQSICYLNVWTQYSVLFWNTTLGFLIGNVLELKYPPWKAFFVVIKKDQHLAGSSIC